MKILTISLHRQTTRPPFLKTGATSSTTLTLPFRCSSLSSIRGRSGAKRRNLSISRHRTTLSTLSAANTGICSKTSLLTYQKKRKNKYGFIKYRFHSYPFPKSLALRREAATPPERKRKEATDAYSVYEEIIKDNIEYDHFVRYGQVDKDRLDEIVSIILETVCSKRKAIRIAGDDYPAELVKAKFMKLNSSHIEFVFDCMKENTTKIRNIKQYLKAVLFNAPNTIDSYYTALVNHDMYGGTIQQSARKKGIPDYTFNEGESL